MQGLCEVLMVAGEASADVHGAEVLRHLQRQCPKLRAYGAGGAAMRALGFEAVVPAEKLAVAGLTEVVLALPRLWWALRTLQRLARARRPQLAVLLDLPDFNLRLAPRLKRLGIHVIYYISPQVWAWRPRRVHAIRAGIDEMLCILPFERAFYAKHGVPVRYVGHPLIEQLPAQPDAAAARARLGLPAEGLVLALLPGSRRQEVARLLPPMLASLPALRARFPALRVVLPQASTITSAQLTHLLRRSPVAVQVVPGGSLDALEAADAAAVCSGTATLQAALLGRPMVVVYRVSWLSYQLLRRLVRVAHIALVNLIAEGRVVPELLQAQLTPTRLGEQLAALLTQCAERERQISALAALRRRLGDGQTAQRVAQIIIEQLQRAPTREMG